MNREHKSNEGLEDDFPFPGQYSQLPCLIFRGVQIHSFLAAENPYFSGTCYFAIGFLDPR